jgi:hypothetical protein
MICGGAAYGSAVISEGSWNFPINQNPARERIRGLVSSLQKSRPESIDELIAEQKAGDSTYNARPHGTGRLPSLSLFELMVSTMTRPRT